MSRNVVEGVRRLQPSTVPADDVEVGADGVLAVRVELFPTAYRIGRGHRLRVVVGGGAFPRYAVNLGVAGSQADALTGRRGRVEVLHDAAHPSRLTVAVLPDAAQRSTPASSASR